MHPGLARHARRQVVVVIAVLVGLASALAVTAVANAARGTPVPGNNGTLKIHELGTPSGTESNDPKVCVFNVESFGLDAGQTGYLVFSVQGGDKPTGTPAGPYAFGPADANGYYASQYFTLDPGHYKATLYGKQLPTGELVDVKAKSKVFKVRCVTASPSPSVAPSVTASPSPSPSYPSPSPSVLPSVTASPSPSPSVAPSESVAPSPSRSPYEPTPSPSSTSPSASP